MTQTASLPQALNRDDIAKSIEFNAKNPRRFPSYTVPLPNWNKRIFVGALVTVPKGNIYTIVDIVDDWAVLVPVVESVESPPAAAYTYPVAGLTPTSIDELIASRKRLSEDEWQEFIKLPADGVERKHWSGKRSVHFPENFTQSATVIVETEFGIFKRSHVLGQWRAAEQILEFTR